MSTRALLTKDDAQRLAEAANARRQHDPPPHQSPTHDAPLMTKPVRLQLSRAKGFSLQALSMATNGLPAVNVARPSKWGNPFNFRKSEYCWTALSYGCRGDRLGRQEASVRAFRAWIAPANGKRVFLHEETPMLGNGKKQVAIGPTVKAGEAPSLDSLRDELQGKNLACWCKPGEPCHADALLELANPPLMTRAG